MTQFRRLVCALCATLFCAGTLTVQAEDNAAQAAARAELLQELQQDPPPQTNDTSSPAMTPAPADTGPATSPQVAAAPAEEARATAGGDNPAQAAARALLLQQLASPPAESNPPATPPAAGVPPAAGMMVITVDDDATRQAQAAADAKAAREAKEAAMAEAARNQASANPTVVAAPKPSTTVVVAQQISLPAPPINADQAARLQALDAKYTANQISPADYFKQREAILSGQ